MTDQQNIDLFWNCLLLAQEETDAATQSANEFTPLNSYDLQPMNTELAEQPSVNIGGAYYPPEAAQLTEQPSANMGGFYYYPEAHQLTEQPSANIGGFYYPPEATQLMEQSSVNIGGFYYPTEAQLMGQPSVNIGGFYNPPEVNQLTEQPLVNTGGFYNPLEADQLMEQPPVNIGGFYYPTEANQLMEQPSVNIGGFYNSPEANQLTEQPSVNIGGFDYPPEAAELIQDFSIDSFPSFPNEDPFSNDQFTVPMNEGLGQITTDSIYQEDINQQRMITAGSINSTSLSPKPTTDYTSSYGFDLQAPTEIIEDQPSAYQNFDYSQLADEPLQENFDFDDTDLFGDDEPIVVTSPVVATSPHLLLPSRPIARPRQRSAARESVRAGAERQLTTSGPSSAPQTRDTAAPKTPARIAFTPAADVSPLSCAGQIEVPMNHGLRREPHKYTVYKPLRPWANIRYNNRGYLHEEITFTSSNITQFFEKHPLGNNLVLRIEKHPYEIKLRETGKPQYTRCRARKCVLSAENRFAVGEIRVSVDEVTGRFGPDQVQNNCPYFAAWYIHLECLEKLMDVVPLVQAGILAPDTRGDLPHEPIVVRRQGNPTNNRMALLRKQVTHFTRWKQMHPLGSQRATGQYTLNAMLWISGQRPGRVKTSYPEGVTPKMITKFLKSNKTTMGWGGRRMAGGTIEEMDERIAAGKAHEIVAPRNGPTGKRGMRVGRSKNYYKRCLSESDPPSSSELEPASPLHRRKRRRTDTIANLSRARRNPQYYDEPEGSSENKSSPDPGLTYFSSTTALPTKENSTSNEQGLFREITSDEDFAPNEQDDFLPDVTPDENPASNEQDNILHEMTTNETSARIQRRASRRTRKQVVTYAISSDDDDTDKENSDPCSWPHRANLD